MQVLAPVQPSTGPAFGCLLVEGAGKHRDAEEEDTKRPCMLVPDHQIDDNGHDLRVWGRAAAPTGHVVHESTSADVMGDY
eukprot:96767-Chlamydomonas_euryale.AAC.1